MIGGNRVLAALKPAARTALSPWMTPVDVLSGETLIEQGCDITELHFPLTGTLSNMILLSDGRAAETACVGNEGVSGLAAFLADAPCGWQVSVQIPGQIVRIPADAFRAQMEADPELKFRLNLLSHDYQAQTAQMAACNILHSATQRTACWLLHALDRTNQATIPVTHQNLSVALGVRRATVGEVLHTIRKTGAVKLGRSRLSVLDRNRLEQLVCECYWRDQDRARQLGLNS